MNKSHRVPLEVKIQATRRGSGVIRASTFFWGVGKLCARADLCLATNGGGQGTSQPTHIQLEGPEMQAALWEQQARDSTPHTGYNTPPAACNTQAACITQLAPLSPAHSQCQDAPFLVGFSPQ
jgi:hypothetical protein